jgi:hypothetical protein
MLCKKLKPLYISLVLITVLTGCTGNPPVDQYTKDNQDCQIADIDYQDCMRERGWMNDDHWKGAPEGNPYNNQKPRK